jgi:hypothetical protein
MENNHKNYNEISLGKKAYESYCKNKSKKKLLNEIQSLPNWEELD